MKAKQKQHWHSMRNTPSCPITVMEGLQLLTYDSAEVYLHPKMFSLPASEPEASSSRFLCRKLQFSEPESPLTEALDGITMLTPGCFCFAVIRQVPH